MDAEDRDIASRIAKHGWTAIGIDDDEPPFVYSIGLMYSVGHPELIVLGLREQGYPLLAALIQLINTGKSFASPGKYDGVLENVPIAVRSVHPSQHEGYLGYAMAYCRHQGDIGKLEAVQVLWPDEHGRFPFEPGCDPAAVEAQPLLDQPFRA